jgi:hypothetical protein
MGGGRNSSALVEDAIMMKSTVKRKAFMINSSEPSLRLVYNTQNNRHLWVCHSIVPRAPVPVGWMTDLKFESLQCTTRRIVSRAEMARGISMSRSGFVAADA